MRFFTFFFFVSCVCFVHAQNVHLALPKEYRKAVANKTRQLDGKPGESYWLNHAHYNIKVNFDPEKKHLSGTETIEYTNNSPDELKKIVLATYQDILNKENKRDWFVPKENLNNGVLLTELSINDVKVDLSDNKQVQKQGTNRIIQLIKPLESGGKLKLSVGWNYSMVSSFNVRGGAYTNERFFICYFYPKIAVYDDVDGWDVQSYTGFTEMYSDFSSYELAITVPDEFKVWGTGKLKDPEKLLSKKYLKRYKKAHKSEKVVQIISSKDLDDSNQIIGTGKKTWVFNSEYVPDVAFALGNKILWDGLSFVRNNNNKEKIFLDVAYDPSSKDFYDVANISKATIIDMVQNSVRWPFPYPQYTVFNGAGGMEFPMMCNNGSQKTKSSTTGLAYHEIAHTYFPFFMGTNERKYAWMDEGWARMFPTDYQDEHFEGSYTPRTQESYLKSAGSEQELPPMTITYQNPNYVWYRQATYNKPHYSYIALREYLGEKTFYKCMNEYMARWNGKHPIPQDFFNTFNNVSGKNLDWFWKNWYFDRNYPDVAVSAKDKTVTLENIGGLYTDFEVSVDFEDGTKKKLNYKADFWLKGMKQDISLDKKIIKIKADPAKGFDVDQNNNSWSL